MANRRHQLGRSDGNVPQFLDSWSKHVKSWINHKAFPVHVLRYEELLEDPAEGFSGLLRFLQCEVERGEFHRLIAAGDPAALRRSWQKDYFQGRDPGTERSAEHQTKLRLCPFAKES